MTSGKKMGKLQSIRGMHDILPEDTAIWRYVEHTIQSVVTRYGYQEIRFPILEQTDLFERSVGEVTDIVEKQMYTFLDQNGESVTLRPEGTAGCVRAGIQHGLFYNQVQRLWYQGPIFRYERPQKGRYRQFHQFGFEAFGMEGPDIDAELILMTARIWEAFGLLPHLTLHLNSLGSAHTRKIYHDALVEYFTPHQEALDEDSQRRLHTNPLRILDSKNPALQSLIQQAPTLLDVLDDASREHFAALCSILDAAGLSYQVDSHLVRGLDYYSRTVFEWLTDKLGAQSAVGAGGRYDGLVTLLGGHDTPAIGFAIGIERLIELLKTLQLLPEVQQAPDIYMITVGEQARQQAVVLAEQLRQQNASVCVVLHCGAGGFKSQFKKADKSGANIALIIGEEEAVQDTVSVKYLRADKPQVTVPRSELTRLLEQF